MARVSDFEMPLRSTKLVAGPCDIVLEVKVGQSWRRYFGGLLLRAGFALVGPERIVAYLIPDEDLEDRLM